MKAIIVNRFDKSFGPAGSQAGIVIFIAGIALSFFNLAFILLMLFGAFVAFTNSSTTINIKEQKAMFSSNLFGLIKMGKWFNIDNSMSIKIMRNNKSFRAYSRGNRSIVVKTHQYKVSLFNENSEEIIPLKYFDDLPQGKKFVDEMSSQLLKV